MTDKTDVDIDGAGETTNSPVSKTSVTGEDERLSKIVKSVIAEELRPIKGDISGLYSRQDKQQNAFSDFLVEFNKGKAKGLSDQDAQTQAESALAGREQEAKRQKAIDLVLERFANETSTKVTGNSNGVADEASKVFEEYSINPNDPEAIPLLGLQGTDLVKAVSKLAIKRAKQSTPDSSEATAITGNPPQPAGVEKLTADYVKDMRSARGKPADLRAIKDKYLKQGVNVHEIDLT